MARYRSRRPDDAPTRARLRAFAAERRRFGYHHLGLLLTRRRAQTTRSCDGCIARSGFRCADGAAASGRWALVGRSRCLTRKTSAGPWTSCPTRWRTDGGSGCCAWWMTSLASAGTGGGHVVAGRPRGARAGRDRRTTRLSGDGGQRQLPAVGLDPRGTELTSTAILLWSQERGIAWHDIAPGKPQQNGFVESFNGRLRDECLNETVFTSLRHARAILDTWRRDYNEVRPHSALSGLPPAPLSLPPCSPASSPLRAGFAGGLRPGLTQAVRAGGNAKGRTEKRRSTEPRNAVTMVVTATQDSTSDWREVGAHVTWCVGRPYTRPFRSGKGCLNGDEVR